MFATQATGTASATSGFKTLTGYAVTDTGGAGSTVTLRDASSGNIFRTIQVGPYEDKAVELGDNPITIASGLAYYFSIDYGTCRWTASGRAA